MRPIFAALLVFASTVVFAARESVEVTPAAATADRTLVKGFSTGASPIIVSSGGALELASGSTLTIASGVTGVIPAANLGATTVGSNLLGLTNPGAITFLRINANNTVTARTGAETLSDIGGIDGSALNASNLTSGTIPDARFPATLPALNGSALTALTATQVGLGNVTNDAQLKVTDLIDEDDMVSDSATRPPSQQSVKAFVEDRIPVTQAFFLTDSVSGVADYLIMQLAEPTDPLATITVNGVSNTDIIKSWITNPSKPGLDRIEEGNHRVFVAARVTSGGAKDVRLRWHLYKRATGGAETLLVTSGYSDTLTALFANIWTVSYYNASLALDATDRLVIKVEAEVTGPGSAPNVEMRVEGNSDARYQMPTSIAALGTIYAGFGANTFTGLQTVQLDALGTTTVPGLLLQNTTAAAAGAQQISPSSGQSGKGWSTNAGGASMDVSFRTNVLPVQGAAEPTGTWQLQSSINGAAFANVLSVTSGGSITATGAFSGAPDPWMSFYRESDNTIAFGVSNNGTVRAYNGVECEGALINTSRTGAYIVFGGGHVNIRTQAAGQGIQFDSGSILTQDAANILAQRNGTNAQAFRIYNTTDGTNSEFGYFGWIANGFEFSTDKAGTGSFRPLSFFGSTITFGTAGVAARWQVDPSGNFLAATDNVYDIGASGANRPRDVFVARDFVGAADGRFYFQARNIFSSPSDGVSLLTNNAANDFNRLQLGGTTSSFPALKRNATGIDIRLADDSAYAPLAASIGTFSTSISTPKITNLTTNGYVTTSSGDGTLVVVLLPWDTTVAASDETSDLTVGGPKISFRMPAHITLQEVRANVNVAGTGQAIIVDIKKGGVSVLSTLLSIDATELTSLDAATPAVISDSDLTDDSVITIHVTQIGSGTAGAGLKVTLKGVRVMP